MKASKDLFTPTREEHNFRQEFPPLPAFMDSILLHSPKVGIYLMFNEIYDILQMEELWQRKAENGARGR